MKGVARVHASNSRARSGFMPLKPSADKVINETKRNVEEQFHSISPGSIAEMHSVNSSIVYPPASSSSSIAEMRELVARLNARAGCSLKCTRGTVP